MLCLLWNQKIYYCVHNGLQLALILSQINSTEAHEKLVDYRTDFLQNNTLFLILLTCSLEGNCESNESQSIWPSCVYMTGTLTAYY